jgi:hypothetical protein
MSAYQLLLDYSLYLYGSGIGNPNVHDHTNLSIIVASGAGGGAGLKGNRHVRFTRTTPLANLHLTLLDKVGVHLDKFADSDEKVDELFERAPERRQRTRRRSERRGDDVRFSPPDNLHENHLRRNWAKHP